MDNANQINPGTIQTSNNSLQTGSNHGSGIPGFEEIPANDLPIPQVKLVGDNTKDTTLIDGTEAEVGKFIHTGKRLQFESFSFRPISGTKKLTLKYGQDDHPDNYIPQYVIVGLDNQYDPFILRLQSSNLNSFRKVLGEMKRLATKGTPPYELLVTASVQTLSNEKFKWNAMNFTWEHSDLSDEEKEKLETMFGQYKGAVHNDDNENEEEGSSTDSTIQAESEDTSDLPWEEEKLDTDEVDGMIR